MALSNYLMQSIVFGLLFYGYGLGLFGQLGAASALPIGIGLYVLQMLLSAAWLRHFALGPAERLWRWFSYRSR